MACAICLEYVELSETFTSSIGDPATTLTDLFYQCTETECDCEQGVCSSCHDYLEKYYKATQIVQEIKKHFLGVLQFSQARQPDLEYEQIVEMEVFEELEQTEEIKHEVEYSTTLEAEVANDAEADIEICVDEDGNEIDIEDNEFLFVCEDDYSEGQDFSTNQQKVKISETDDNVEYPRECEECGQMLRSKNSYASHFRNNHFKGYVCEYCGKTLMSRTGFLTHKENHAGDTFECNECGQSFKNKFRLKHHMAWHSGQKPFQCEICDKRFVHSIALYRHKRIHEDNTRCIECMECGFKFRTNSHLRRHMLSHSGAKPFACHICGKVFSQTYNLRVHIKEHENPGSTKQRRYKCKRCSKSFRNKENYDDHCLADDCETPVK